MICREVDEWLMTSGGEPVPLEVAEHLRTCDACRALVSLTRGETGSRVLNADVGKKILAAIAADLKPVPPLASPSTLAFFFVCLSATVAVIGGIVMGPHGFHLMTPVARSGVFGVLLAITVFGGMMAARSMRPASGSLHGVVLAAVCLAVPEIVFLSLFRSDDFGHFLHAGSLCVAIGLAFSVPTTVAVWWIINRGFVVAPVTTGILAGVLGGMTGLCMLEVHCPLLTAPHVGVWHIAMVAMTIGVGAVLGSGRSWAAGSGRGRP